MGLFEDIGKALGHALSALAEFVADAFKGIARPAMRDFAGSSKDAVKEIDKELTTASLDPKLFNTKEFQELAIELKKKLEGSPEGVVEWFQDALGGIFKGFYDLVMLAVAPWEIKDFDTAKTEAGHLMFLGLDLVILVGVLDAIACAASVTLIRNLAHIGKLFMGTFGFDRLAATTIQPALQAGVIPWLNYGWNKKYQAQIPGSTDLVRFALREVWDPERRPELLKEKPGADYYELMKYRGFSDDRCDDYWAAHWVLPSVGQLNEMLHRRVIDLATWDRFVKYNDFDPEVRPWLRAISYKPYTRVDTRRMWDLALLSDTEVYNNYRDLGYDDAHARRMTIWTKVYVLSVELRARYSKGWITPEQILSELVAAGMPKRRAEIWMQKIVKADKEERTTPERDITKAEIVKGVKEGILNLEDAIEMLIGLGYDRFEAEYILEVNLAKITGSPETWSEYQKLVNLRRKSQGLPVKEIPEEIIKIEKQILEFQERRQKIAKQDKSSELVKKLDKKIKALEKKHRELRRGPEEIGQT